MIHKECPYKETHEPPEKRCIWCEFLTFRDNIIKELKPCPVGKLTCKGCIDLCWDLMTLESGESVRLFYCGVTKTILNYSEK